MRSFSASFRRAANEIGSRVGCSNRRSKSATNSLAYSSSSTRSLGSMYRPVVGSVFSTAETSTSRLAQ